jgi:acyl-CoA synthetase (AMP-forming)/AMP-acid ligase II
MPPKNWKEKKLLPRLTVCKVKNANHSVSQVGMPLTGIELRIAGSEEIGPVEFRGKSVSLGEVMPDGRIKEYAGWIRSGDMGRLERGTLHVFGRYDQVCNIRGERTSLLEIEAALLRIPKLSHALVWAAAVEGEEVPLVVLGGEEKPSPELLREHLKNSISRNAWPVKIFWADPWLLTDNQKTDRVALQEKAARKELPLLWELLPQAT